MVLVVKLTTERRHLIPASPLFPSYSVVLIHSLPKFLRSVRNYI